jgi:hypothetical protein
MVQLATNTNYMGNPIRPESGPFTKGHVPDAMKYWSTANPTLVGLSKALNELTGGNVNTSGLIDVSPETVEHLSTSYIGGMGRLFNMVSNLIGTVYTNPDTQMRDLMQNIPGFNIIYRAQSNGVTNNVYAQMKLEAQTQLNRAKDARANASLNAIERANILAENRAGIFLQQALTNTTGALNKISEEENKLMKMNIPSDVKAKRRKVLTDRKQAIMKRFIKQGATAGLAFELN